MAKQATRTATRNKPHLMMQIAVMRYKMNYTQAEIAKRLNLSTMTVSRLLDKAREEGIVTFHVKTPVETDSVLEEKLRERYGFDEAFVIRNGMGQGDAEMISRAIAFYLDMIISPGDILGIGIGRTTNRLMPYLTLPSIAQPSDLEVVQLSGGLNGTSEHNPVSSLQEFTRQFGIRGRFLQLPIYAPTLEAFKAMESSYLGEMRELWKRCTVCLCGVGRCGQQSMYRQENVLSVREMDELIAAGAVGNFFGRWFDSGGRFIKHRVNSLAVGIPPELLVKIPKRILITYGEEELRSISGVLAMKIYNVFVTNEKTARELLA